MRPATLAVWLWAILFPVLWISIMATATEDGGPPRLMVYVFFGVVGFGIWAVGLLIAIGLRFLVHWLADRRVSQ
jgi:hypothetical protein